MVLALEVKSMCETNLIFAFCFWARKNIHNGPKIEESLDDWFSIFKAPAFLSPRDYVSLITPISCQTTKLMLPAMVDKYDQEKFCYRFQSVVTWLLGSYLFPNILNQLK